MNDPVITLRVESDLKASATAVAQELGIPLATYLKMCLKRLVQEREIHFRSAEIPNQATAER